MAHPRLRLRTSNCSLLLIYLPRKQGRQRRGGWGDAPPHHFGQGDPMPLIPPLAAVAVLRMNRGPSGSMLGSK